MPKVTTARYEIIIRGSKDQESIPRLTLAELAEHCECQVEIVERLVRIGAIDPIGDLQEEPKFLFTAVSRLSRALRLKRDFGLNLDAVALVLDLLDRIDELERHTSRS